MKQGIVIGESLDGKPFTLPVNVVTSTLVIYGGKGMGKTNFGGVLVEELTAAGLRWSAIDPLGVWWGLRYDADGRGKGIECLILGGAKGDLPIEPTGGAVVADLVVENDANVIIDISRKPSGEMWSIRDKVRFVTEYAYRLFQRQGELVEGRRREPIFQILDEAARYIPQVIDKTDAMVSTCVSAWNQLVEEGRNIGIGVGLLTQRSARMNKSVSELADSIFAFRTVGPNSVGAIVDWLGEHVAKERIRAMVETIRALPVGQCLVVSPGWLQFESVVKIRLRTTFDSSATPKPGQQPRKVHGAGAQPDLARYAELMRETVERVKENDPRELRQQIAELKKRLHGCIDGKVLGNAVEQAGLEVAKERDALWMRAFENYRRQAEAAIKQVSLQFDGALHALRVDLPAALEKIDVHLEINKAQPPRKESRRSHQLAAPAVAAHPPKESRNFVTPGPKYQADISDIRMESDGEKLTNPQRAILHSLAQFEAIGRQQVPKKWLAALANVSHKSSGFDNNLGRLRNQLGLIDYPQPGLVALTDAGRAHVPAVDPPRTSAEMLERSKGVLTNPQAALLQVLHDAYPEPVDRAALAEAVNVSPGSSGFDNNLGALRSAGMVNYPAPKTVRAADWLFLEK